MIMPRRHAEVQAESSGADITTLSLTPLYPAMIEGIPSIKCLFGSIASSVRSLPSPKVSAQFPSP